MSNEYTDSYELYHGRLAGWIDPHHKYTSRVKKNGKWVYKYDKEKVGKAINKAWKKTKNKVLDTVKPTAKDYWNAYKNKDIGGEGNNEWARIKRNSAISKALKSASKGNFGDAANSLKTANSYGKSYRKTKRSVRRLKVKQGIYNILTGNKK